MKTIVASKVTVLPYEEGAFDKLCEDGYLLKNGKKLIVLNAEAMLNAYQ